MKNLKINVISGIFALFVLFFARKVHNPINLEHYIEKYRQYMPNNVFYPDSQYCQYFYYPYQEYEELISCTVPVIDECFRRVTYYGSHNTISSIFFAIKEECKLYLGLFIEKYGKPKKSYPRSWLWDKLYVNSQHTSSYDNFFTPIQYFLIRG